MRTNNNPIDKIKSALDVLSKGEDGDFRGGDPEYAQLKREEKREEEELESSLTPTMARAIAAIQQRPSFAATQPMTSLKAQPGEEAGEFRGGDPELLQQKREEKREQALEEGGNEEDTEEEEIDEAEIEEAELAAQERAEDQGKAMPMIAAPVFPIDSLEDYSPRDNNGDPIDSTQRRYKQPNIDPAPVRDERTKHLPWSEVVGFKVPRLGAPWAHLRQYLMVGDVKGAQAESEKILKSFDGPIFDHEFRKAFFDAYDLNRGVLFDPSLCKARRGEIISGHKYVYRWLGDDGHWLYEYSDGMHSNHGIGHSGHAQGHSLDVHPEFDHEMGTAEEAFHHARQKQLEVGGNHRFQMTDRETMQPKNMVLRIKPGAKQGFELHEDPNLDEEDPNNLKLSTRPTHKGGTLVSRMGTNWNNFDKFMRTKHVNTETDVHGNPWVHWYLPEPKKKEERKTEKPRVQMRWAQGTPYAGYKPKRSEGAWGFQGGTMDAFRRRMEMGLAMQSELTGQGEIGKFDLDPHRPMTNSIQAGRLPKTLVKHRYKDADGNLSTKRKGHKLRAGVDWANPNDPNDDRPSMANVAGDLQAEHFGLAVHAALATAKRIDFKRREAKLPTLEELGLQHQFVSQLASSPEVAEAYIDAADRYSPYYRVTDPKTGEKKPVKFSTYLHQHLRGAMAANMRKLIDEQFPQIHLDKESWDDPDNKALQSHTKDVINKIGDFHQAQQTALEKEAAAETEAEQRAREQQELDDWGTKQQENWDNRLEQAKHAVDMGMMDEEEYANRKMMYQQAKNEIDNAISEGPEAASKFFSLWNEDVMGGAGFVEPPPSEDIGAVDEHLRDSGHHTLAEPTGVDMDHLQNVYTGHIHTPLEQLSGSRDLRMDPHLRQRISSENLQTVGDLMASTIENPVPGPSADAMERVFSGHRVKHADKPGEFAPFATWNTPTTSVLGKAQPQQAGVVSYLGARGEPGSMQHMYESPEGNIVQGTNAPEDHEYHDPSVGPPMIHPQEPTPETHPNMFDEQGRKLHMPIPEGVDEVETNPEYDPDPGSGNSWVKRYKDPDSGDTRHVYLHRDQATNPTMQRNNALRYVDAQLPKIRDDYTERLRSDTPEDKTVGLFLALMDQAKLPAKYLANLEAGQVSLNGKVATFKQSHGNIKVALDDRTAEILEELLEDKYDADPVFVANGHKINIMQINEYLHGFGVSPDGFQTYHTTRLFSQEFQNLMAKEKGDLSIPHLREIRHNAAINVAQVLGTSPEEVEHHVDPIAVEALFLAAAVHRHKIAKAHGTCPECSEPWSLCEHTKKKNKLDKAYKLQGKTEFQGLPISIENKKGSVRKWYDPHEKREGETKMNFDYGYIRGTLGTDGDHVDVYLGPVADAKTAYVVHQRRAPNFKRFDEDKVMLGFASGTDAKQAYLKQYDDPRFFGNMTSLPMDKFKEKLKECKGKVIKSLLEKAQTWVVSAHGPSKTAEEESFSNWIHTYPVHEHHVHWNALTRQAMADDSERHHSDLGVRIGTKPDHDPLEPEEATE